MNLVPEKEVDVHREALEKAREIILVLADYKCIYPASRIDEGGQYCDGCPLVDNEDGEQFGYALSAHESDLICTFNKITGNKGK